MISQELIKKSKSAMKFTLVFKTTSQFLGGVVMILLVRALSEAEYGIYNLLYSGISLINLVASLGIGNTLQRYIPEYYQRGEFIIAHNLYRITSFLRLGTNVIILGLVLVLWDLIAPILKLSDHKAYFMLFTLIIFLDMQRRLLDTCLSSFLLQKYAKSIGCLFPLVKLIGYTYIIFFDKNLWHALLADLAAYTIVFTGLQLLYFKKIPTSQGKLKRFDRHERKRVTRYAMFYNLNDAGDGLLNSYFDNFIIIMFLNPVAVGAYSFSVTLTVILGRLFPLSYFMEVIRPAFFSAGVSSSFKDPVLFFQNCIKINSVFTIPCFFFLVLFSPDIILLFFGGKFIDYAAVPCGLFFFFQVLYFPVGLIAQLREKANIVLYSKIFAVYNLVADFVFIQYFGIWGAVFATGTAVLCKNLFIWYFVRADASFKGMGSFFIKTLLFWGMTSALAFSTTLLFDLHWLRIGLGVLIFGAGFFIQFRCNLFTPREQEVWQLFSERSPKIGSVFKRLKMVPQ